MAVIKETLLVCDGCGDVYASSDARHDPGYVQRESAREWENWVHRNGKDYCDLCRDKKENK